MRVGFIISLIIAVIVALFGIQNAAVISVNFFYTKIDISLALIIFVSAIIGAIIVALLGLQKEFRLRLNNKQLAKKVNNFQTENEILKNKIEALENNNKVFNDEIKWFFNVR